MAKYRKKPVVVDAEQFYPDRLPHPDGVEQYVEKSVEAVDGTQQTWFAWRVLTAGCWTSVRPGDWVVTDPNSGDRWPVEKTIFERTYDLVVGGD